MKTAMVGLVVGLFVVGLGGCSAELPPEASETSLEVQSMPNVEVIHWRPTLHDEGWQNAPLHEQALDPCSCAGEHCAEDWVDESFGCDVCVTLTCEGQPSHICNPC